MKNWKRVFPFALLVLRLIPASSQEPFSGTEAFQYIETLCRPEFEGRKTGLDGARKAAEWIASRFQEWNLDPAGGMGSFIQEYPMIVTHQIKKSKLQLKNGLFGPVRYQQGNDFTVYFNSGSGKVTAEVVFVGYGISEPEKDWDDYAGIDVSGKIILIYRGLPQDGKNWSAQNERDYKMKAATAKGAAGILMLEARDWAIRGGTIHEEGYDPSMPAVAVSKKVARDIFQGTYRNLDNTLRDLAKKPQSFHTGKTVAIDLKLARLEPGIGQNVIGILRGNDPVLKNEYIVVGGHMDHNGTDPEGRTYFGADDNASGTSVVMELARTLAGSSHKLKRSVVFACFGGEEQGLRGSQFFADHPTVVPQDICLMFNFDMEGCGNGGGGLGGRNYFPAVVDTWAAALSDSVRKNLYVGRGWGYGGSDHAPFIVQGIPAFGFFSSGDHPFYHRLEDTPKTINVQSLQFIGDRASELIVQFADASGSLLFNGNLQGRCFLHLGSQMELDGGSCVQLGNLHPDSLTAMASQRCIHGMVVTLTKDTGRNADPSTLFAAADSFYTTVQKQNHFLIPFQNGGSLNQSSGSGKIAVALGLDERDLDVDDIGLFRNLLRLGVRFLRIQDPSSPLFDQDGWSPFGSTIVQLCQGKNIIMDWTIDDAYFTQNRLSGLEGKILLRMTPDDALNAPFGFEDLVQGKDRLAYIECSPGTNVQELMDLIARYGDQNVHFSVLHRCSGKKESSCPAPETWAYPLFQKVYESLSASKDKKSTYDDMTRILGENLKAFLN
jgi:hypothetical protein